MAVGRRLLRKRHFELQKSIIRNYGVAWFLFSGYGFGPGMGNHELNVLTMAIKES